jgi:hypothetical protein
MHPQTIPRLIDSHIMDVEEQSETTISLNIDWTWKTPNRRLNNNNKHNNSLDPPSFGKVDTVIPTEILPVLLPFDGQARISRFNDM